MFTRHLAVMLAAGIPLVRCLEALRAQEEYPNFGAVVSDLARFVSIGGRLSEATYRFPRVFPGLYARMIRVGEESGQLVVALQRLSRWLERDLETTRHVKRATTYPLVVSFTGVSLTLALFTFVIPAFLEVFSSLQVELPLMTRVVLFGSQLARNPGVWVLGATAVASFIYGLSKVWASPLGRVRLTRLLLDLPLVGRILLYTSHARFSSAAQMSLVTGLDMLTSLDMASAASSNELLIADRKSMVESMSEGQSPAQHMAMRPDLYDGVLIQLLKVAEETGEMELTFQRMSTYYDNESRYLTDGLTAALEPVMLLGVGGMVALLLLSVFLPMYSYIQAI